VLFDTAVSRAFRLRSQQLSAEITSTLFSALKTRLRIRRFRDLKTQCSRRKVPAEQIYPP